MSEITYTVVRVAITVLAALVSAYLIPYLKQLSKKEEYKDITEAVKSAVQAAEQKIKGSGKGEEKKKMVLAFMTEWLNENGIKIELDQLDNLIEAFVYEMRNGVLEK